LNKNKVLVIGLDSAPSALVFEKYLPEMPNLQKLMEQGAYGLLESCHPPITIPAWMVMATSKSPGRLGLYGFRHRKGFSYTEGWIASSQSIAEKTIWDLLATNGKKVCLVGVPPGYPPKPVNGELVSCFITPSSRKEYTYPPELKHEIEKLVGDYVFDVTFRTDDRDKLRYELFAMTEKRFKVIKHLMTTRSWDFFMFVEIGVDRLHHAFWKFLDENHPKYERGNKYENVGREYYRMIDKMIGELVELAGKDTAVLIMSDHGTKEMRGAFCVNEWLIKEGYLVLRNKPSSVTDLEKADIDWAKTRAWGWGGYYARIFLNVKDREPMGIVGQDQVEETMSELKTKLLQIRDHDGRVMQTTVHRPQELYSECKGDSPDLMVYFDDLYWRSAGTLGHDSLYLSENDTGPDDSVHAREGIFVLRNPKSRFRGKIIGARIYDIAPTLLQIMGIPIPSDMEGRVIKETLN
jgi:predicted AlkP superfamily phosphohydrolase/phosphomutase